MPDPFLSKSSEEITRAFEQAMASKDWETVKLICDTQNPFKPANAERALVLKQAVDANEFQDIYDISARFKKDNSALVEGPNLKSAATYELENLFRKLLTTNHFKVTDYEQDKFIVFEDGTSFNWTNIRKHANFQETTLTQDDFDSYTKYMRSHNTACTLNPAQEERYRAKIYESNIKKGNPLPDPPLSFAEMQAINIYTSEFYKEMNGVLRGKYTPSSNDLNSQNAIIQSVMCAHGLRKIPSHMVKECYRGTGTGNLAENIQHAATKDVIRLNGFVSTSIDKHRSFDSPVHLKIKDVVGIYIAPISQNVKELEFLIPPTTIQLSSYKSANDKHIFEARGASELACLSQEGLENYLDNKPPEFESTINFILVELQAMADVLKSQAATANYTVVSDLIQTMQTNFANFKNKSIDMDQFETKCGMAVDKALTEFQNSKWERFLASVKIFINKVIPDTFEAPTNHRTIHTMTKFKQAVSESRFSYTNDASPNADNDSESEHTKSRGM